MGVISSVRAFFSILADAAAVAKTLREVERARWVEGPATLVARLRERGKNEDPRSSSARRRLLRLIHHLDRLMKGGPNCYRRSLTRVALDRASADEPFVLGLNLRPPPGGEAAPSTNEPGHAWLDGTEPGARYDVEFRL